MAISFNVSELLVGYRDWIYNLSRKKGWVFDILLGIVATLSISPYGWWLIFIYLPAVFWRIGAQEKRIGALFVTFRYIISSGTLMCYWCFFAFFHGEPEQMFTIGNIALAVCSIAAGFAFLSLFSALPGFILCHKFKQRSTLENVLYCAAIFVLFDFIRLHSNFLLPWNSYGAMAMMSLPFSQGASLWGVLGQSFFVILMGLTPVLWLENKKYAIGVLCIIASIYGFGSWRLYVNPPADIETMVRVVQPAILQKDKWLPKKYAEITSIYKELTQKESEEDIHLVIWPEVALPRNITKNTIKYYRLDEILPDRATLVSGASQRRFYDSRKDVRVANYNVVFTLTKDKKFRTVYDKVRLFPFGEYIPAREFFNSIGLSRLVNLGGNATPGVHHVTVEGTKDYPSFSPLICYETIFSGQVVSSPRPSFMLNVSNYAWFGISSPALKQKQWHLRLRSIEEGMPLVHSSSIGYSSVIDSYGRVRALLSMGERGVIDQFLPETAEPTIFSRWKHYPFLLLSFSILLFIHVRVFFRRKRNAGTANRF